MLGDSWRLYRLTGGCLLAAGFHFLCNVSEPHRSNTADSGRFWQIYVSPRERESAAFRGRRFFERYQFVEYFEKGLF